jgi:hypothetical protein
MIKIYLIPFISLLLSCGGNPIGFEAREIQIEDQGEEGVPDRESAGELFDESEDDPELSPTTDHAEAIDPVDVALEAPVLVEDFLAPTDVGDSDETSAVISVVAVPTGIDVLPGALTEPASPQNDAPWEPLNAGATVPPPYQSLPAEQVVPEKETRKKPKFIKVGT